MSSCIAKHLLVGVCVAMSPLLWAESPAQYEAQKLVASNGAAGDRFGTSVAASGDTAVIGAQYASRNRQFTGAAYVYARDAGGTWIEEAELLASDSAGQPAFGASVALDDDTAVIGAPFSGYRGRGSAYVYQRNPGGVWTEQAKLLPSDSAYRFGRALAVSGDTVLVGVQDDEHGFAAGAAYVFTRDAGGSWSEQTKLVASDGRALDYFGESVALDGDVAVIGAERNEGDGRSTGSAYVFVRDHDGGWSEEAKLRARDGDSRSRFGYQVAMSGSTVLAAAGDSVYVFTRDAAGAWSEQALLGAADDSRRGFTQFVSSVAISGDTASVQRGGSRFLYTRNFSGVWSERVELRARDDGPVRFFGESAALSGETALVGAPGEGLAGDLSGALYVFDVGRLEPRVFLHCSRDLSDDDTVGIAVVTGEQVTIKALDGTLIRQFYLNGLDDVIDTQLMADTSGNGAPELVLLSRASSTAAIVDLVSGAQLGTIAFPAIPAPIDLALIDDQTGNGIPDLAILGLDPVRVQVRDGLTGALVSNVEFSRYATAKDLLVYPDIEGSGPGLAVLAENRRPEGADKIEIRSASGGESIREIWLGKHWRVLEQARIGGLNGSSSKAVAVLQQEPQYLGSVRVQIRDIESGGLVNFVGFANRYLPQALVVIPDIDGNGADELVLFGRHHRGFNQKAVIKDARTGEKLDQLFFDRDFPARDFVSCGDINGNGAADLAMLGQRPEDGQLQVIVKDSRTGERLGLVWFQATAQMQQIGGGGGIRTHGP